MCSRRGLSLVEMLIILAIMVMLLSLLAVGPNASIYESGVAACAAHQKGAAAGTLTYAVNNARRYPSPPAGRFGSPEWLGRKDRPEYDLRPQLRDFLPVNLLVCPLSPVISLRSEDTDDDDQIFSSYSYWSAWQFNPSNGRMEEGMFRIGDR
jgi:hypothetical protein